MSTLFIRGFKKTNQIHSYEWKMLVRLILIYICFFNKEVVHVLYIDEISMVTTIKKSYFSR